MKLKPIVLLGAAILIASVQAGAATISGNFCSVAQIQDYPAGVVPTSDWNDFTAPAGYAAAATAVGGVDLFYDGGGALTSTTKITWDVPNGGSQNTDDNVIRPTPPATTGGNIIDGQDQLMAGYLQASRLSPSIPKVTLQGLGMDAAFGGDYSVILYLNGDGDVTTDGTTANNQYAVSIWSDNTKTTLLSSTVYGRQTSDFVLDHTVPNSLADFTQITSTINGSPTEGNYVRFDGLTSASFYLEIEGVLAGTAGTLNDGGHGVALNGFQVVPEPATMSLFGLGAVALIRRRRNRK